MSPVRRRARARHAPPREIFNERPPKRTANHRWPRSSPRHANRRQSDRNSAHSGVALKTRIWESPYSSRNASKHGLTRVTSSSPNEDPAAYQERHLDQWLDLLPACNRSRPASPSSSRRRQVRNAKLDRCTRLASNRTPFEKVRHAVDQHDLDRLSEAETLGQRLLYEADGPHGRCPRPMTPFFRLRAAESASPTTRSTSGTKTAPDDRHAGRPVADRPLDRTRPAMLELHGYWHYPEKFRALWMRPAPRGRRRKPDRRQLRSWPATSPTPIPTTTTRSTIEPLGRGRFQDEDGHPGAGTDVLLPDERPSRTPPLKIHLTAVAIMWDILKQELDLGSTPWKAYLDPIDQADAPGARSSRAMFDGQQPEGVLNSSATRRPASASSTSRSPT